MIHCGDPLREKLKEKVVRQCSMYLMSSKLNVGDFNLWVETGMLG